MRFGTIQTTQNGTVSNRVPRKKNAEVRPREYLRPEEVEKLLKAAKGSRNGERDSLMMSMAFNHALRATELVNLEWEQLNLTGGTMFVKRQKKGKDSTHYLRADEIRILKRMFKEANGARYVFISERGSAMTIRGFHKMVVLAGQRANFEFPLHPHMLRHAKGYQLTNRGTDLRSIQDYMGHKNLQTTVLYTALDPKRLRGLEN